MFAALGFYLPTGGIKKMLYFYESNPANIAETAYRYFNHPAADLSFNLRYYPDIARRCRFHDAGAVV